MISRRTCVSATALVAVAVFLALGAGAGFGAGGQVPIKGSEHFAPAADATLVWCGVDAVYIPSTIAASGTISHLGLTNTTIHVANCSADAAGLTMMGTADHFAANGDTLHISHYVVVIDPTSGAGHFTTITFTGGTAVPVGSRTQRDRLSEQGRSIWQPVQATTRSPARSRQSVRCPSEYRPGSTAWNRKRGDGSGEACRCGPSPTAALRSTAFS